MKKPHNYHISSVNKEFSTSLAARKLILKNLEKEIIEKKICMNEFHAIYLATKNDITRIRYQDCKASYRNLVNLKKFEVEVYLREKNMYKKIQRAIEERWMDGFAEGVKFVKEAENENS